MEYREKLAKLGITLTKSGKQLCPVCSATRKNKSDPCLSVTYTNDAVLYKCHNCDFKGAVFYRSKYEKTRTYRKPRAPAVNEQNKSLVLFFEKRGISKAILDKYGVSLSDKGEIILPYYKDGELVNIKYRLDLVTGKKEFRQEKDTEKTLFGMDLVKDTDTLIWVEGEPDVLAFAQQGIPAVSIPQGASEKKLECIENCFEFIEKFSKHIIAVDNDPAGDTLKLNLLNRLGKEKCSVVDWKQYKDANEALMAGEDLNQFIYGAKDFAPDGILNFYDSFDDIYNYLYERDTNWYSTGWLKLDNIIKLRTSHLMIVSGYPSRGKSTFTDNLLINLAKRYDMKHLIASFESTQAKHYVSLLEMYSQCPIYKLSGNTENVFGDAFAFLADHFYRFDVDRLWNIDEICDRAERAVKKYGVKTLTIDPYNRLNNDFKDREDKYIGSILSKLSMLARRLDILVIFVAHPKKPDGEKMPNMYSISGSGDWYNMADYGIIVHRERAADGKLSDRPTVFVEKVKNFSLGNPSGGSVDLYYNKDLRILENHQIKEPAYGY